MTGRFPGRQDDVEFLHVLVNDGVRFLLGNRLEHTARCLQGDKDVLADGQVADDALITTVFGGVRDFVLQSFVYGSEMLTFLPLSV